ncbi:hypothetical protein FB563_1208 [Streptomyces puniciscabiei]|uniref:Uncharacterized protein n=1 Tax=Streptomyces puniciscabiei TaxID=164348 RepID=A0A542UB27_9ACTN|nr:hypothetical protein [Streptomyces puniciscabiei]TQK96270.1 hypothetical protein FB563_1208 [Streptomyces puniciscabiei]
MSEAVPTDPGAEAERGRVALWLDPDDLRWLAGHCCCPDDADRETRDRCSRLRFRASAALHKSGRSG